MPLLSALLVVVIGGGALWGWGFTQRGMPWTWLIAGSIGIVLVAAITALIHHLLRQRAAAATIATGLAAPPAAAAGAPSSEEAAMREQFARSLAALKQTPSGAAALATLPWYLVIGSPGSGKTTLIQESGLAFSSHGHGLRSIRGIGGTRNCDWWFTDHAVFLDTAGRYTTQPDDQPEWFAFLDLIRRTRGGQALNGIIVVASIPELLRDHEAAITANVRPIRERIIEVCNRLKLVLPVYVVFSKADLMGGFKDFFAHLPRSEREQVWGFTLAPDAAGALPVGDRYDAEIRRLAERLDQRRLPALAGDRPPAQLAKALLFPSNFSGAQRWLGGFVAELMRPYPIPDPPLWRGVYLTSGTQPQRPDAAPAQPAPPPPPSPAAPAQASGASDMSIFFMAGTGAKPAQDSDLATKGFFLKQLFTDVIIGDRSLAGRPRAIERRKVFARALLAYGSIAIGLIACLILSAGVLADRDQVQRTNRTVAVLQNALAGDDVPAQLDALDQVRNALTELRSQASGATARSAAAEAHKVYLPLLRRWYITPAADRLAGELRATGASAAARSGGLDELYELVRSYQMLSGSAGVELDPRVLLRTLRDVPRFAVRFTAADGSLADRDLQRARDHLAYLLAALPNSADFAAKPDQPLIDRSIALLGDHQWIQQGYGELTASVGDLGTIDRSALIAGDQRELLTCDYTFPALFSRHGFSHGGEAAIDEKSDLLVQRLAELKARPMSSGEIRRRLRTLFARETASHWLKLVAGIRPLPFPSLNEGAARLRLLTAVDSPLRELPRKLADQDPDLRDADAAPRLPSDPSWMADGLDAAKDLAVAADKLAAATRQGERSRDLVKLSEFAAAADKCASRFVEIASRIDGDAPRAAVLACLGNLIGALHAGLAAELASEIELRWQAEVVRPWNDQCAGKYPFASTETMSEAPLPAVVALFHPKTGAFTTLADGIDKLRSIKCAGKDLLPVSFDYLRLVEGVAKLRAGFLAEGDELTCAFTITFIQRKAVENVVLSIGAQKFALNDRPDRRMRFTWAQKDGGGAKLLITTTGKLDLTREYATPGWGLLRLFQVGNPQKNPAGGHLLSYTFHSRSDGQNYQADLILEAPALEVLVAGDVLKAMNVPLRIRP